VAKVDWILLHNILLRLVIDLMFHLHLHLMNMMTAWLALLEIAIILKDKVVLGHIPSSWYALSHLLSLFWCSHWVLGEYLRLCGLSRTWAWLLDLLRLNCLWFQILSLWGRLTSRFLRATQPIVERIAHRLRLRVYRYSLSLILLLMSLKVLLRSLEVEIRGLWYCIDSLVALTLFSGSHTHI